MKKFNLVLATLFVAVMSVAFLSCTKEAEIVKDSTQQLVFDETEYQLSDLLKSNMTIVEGVPTFESRVDFDSLTNLLEEEYSSWNEKFYNKWKLLGEEGVEAKAEELNFNHDLPIETFEKYYGINTLWSVIKQQQEIWLDNEILDFNNNPTNHALTESVRPFANEFGEYAVGKSIYHVEEEGIIYEITDGDYSKLQLIRGGIDNTKGLENVVIHNLDRNSDDKVSCVAYKRLTDFVDYGLYCKYMILDLDWDGYGSAAKAKTEAYKQKSGGGWKYWYTYCYAMVWIKDYKSDCSYLKTYSDTDNNNSLSWYCSVHVYKSGTGFRTQSGYTNGTWNFWGKFSISDLGESALYWE